MNIANITKCVEHNLDYDLYLTLLRKTRWRFQWFDGFGKQLRKHQANKHEVNSDIGKILK